MSCYYCNSEEHDDTPCYKRVQDSDRFANWNAPIRKITKYGSKDGIYIGRPSGNNDWKYGNPFVFCKNNRAEVIYQYEQWLLTGNDFGNKAATKERRQWILNNVNNLKGKTLLCFCDFPNEDCHGRVLYNLANKTYATS